MSDEEKKPDAPRTGAPETEAYKPAAEQPQAQQPTVDPAAKPPAEPTPATEKPAPAENPASTAPPASAEKPAGQRAAAAKPASEPPAAEKPARPAAPAKPAAGTTAKPAGAKPAGKPAPPPDPRVEAAKAKAEELKAALDAHFFQGDSAVRAITAGAVERTAATDAASNEAQAPTDVAAPESAPASPDAAAAPENVANAPSVVLETGAALHTPVVVIDKDYWQKAVEFLRIDDNWKLNYIEMMAGTDYPDKGYIEVVVYAQSTSLGHWVCLKTRADRQNPVVPSLVPSHPGVNWEEREIYDLLGITFTDHPDLRRIMMWDEYKGHPLRKDFNEWEVGEDADGSSR